jgi:hypothetical protein
MRKSLATVLALRTGLSKYECDAILKVIAFEITDTMREYEVFSFAGLGTFTRPTSVNENYLLLRLSQASVARIKAKKKKEEHEVIFE